MINNLIKMPIVYHIIILECASGLEKSSHSIGNIFSSSVWIFATPILKPSIKKHTHTHLKSNNKAMKLKLIKLSFSNVRNIFIDIPANPIFSPHFRTVWIIGLKVVTVPTVASIDLT